MIRFHPGTDCYIFLCVTNLFLQPFVKLKKPVTLFEKWKQFLWKKKKNLLNSTEWAIHSFKFYVSLSLVKIVFHIKCFASNLILGFCNLKFFSPKWYLPYFFISITGTTINWVTQARHLGTLLDSFLILIPHIHLVIILWILHVNYPSNLAFTAATASADYEEM